MKKYFVIIIMLIVFQICFSQTYYVDPTDPLNFDNIQSAVDRAINNGGSATIIVCNPNVNGTPYTYNENVTINFNQNEELWSLSLIKNSALGQGEVIINSPSITSNTIHINGHSGTYAHIEGFTIRNGYHGIAIINMLLDTTFIVNCIITENESGIKLFNTMSHILNCTIIQNNTFGVREAWNSAIENQLGHIVDSEISNNEGNGLDLESCWDIINCTIVDNNEIGLLGEDCFDITSSIIRGNTIQIELDNYIEVKYSNIQGGFAGTGNIDADPLFVDPLNGDYQLTQLSTCIDTGDPILPCDLDATVSDMGCYYFHHEYDIKRFEEGIQWVSFPNLTEQVIYDPPLNPYIPNVDESYEKAYDENGFNGLLQHPDTGELTINGFDIIHGYRDGDIDIDYIEPNFIDHLFDNMLFRHEGYKIEVLDGADPTVLIVDGDRLGSYTLDMPELENFWLGYYIPYPQNIEHAFGNNFGNVNRVWAEDWYYDARYIQRGGDPNQLSSNSTRGKTMEYGKMYIVQMYHDVTNFSWNGSTTAEEPTKKATSESFTYTEKADYEVIDVVSIPSNVIEIGVFEDEVCVGAVVVEDSCAQILVYSDSANRDPIPFTFEIITGRGFSTPLKDYLVLNQITGEFEPSVIISGRQGYSAIKLGEQEELENIIAIPILLGNYPNPFNPTTTISYSLPDEQDIELTIFNIKGQKVKTLYSGITGAGKHTMTWEGKDSNDKQVSSGIYFYKLKTNNKELTRKMLMMK